MRKSIPLEITEEEAYRNWASSLTQDQLLAWMADCQEIASLIGLDTWPSGPWEKDQKAMPFYRMIMSLWMIHQAGYPLPVLQSLREGKGPGGQP